MAGLSIGLKCATPERVELAVSSWEVDSAAFSTQWTIPATSPIRIQLDASVGFSTYVVSLGTGRVLLASSRYSALAVSFFTNTLSCAVPVVSPSDDRLAAVSAPDLTVSPSAWVLCADPAVCSNRSLSGLPVMAVYAHIQQCPSSTSWRGWPRYFNTAGGLSATLVRYLPSRCRSRSVDIVAISLLVVNSIIMFCWLVALVLGVVRTGLGAKPPLDRRGEMWMLLGLLLCVFDQVSDALWFLLTDWELEKMALENVSFSLIVLNQLVFVIWGALKLFRFYAPYVVVWFCGLFYPCGVTLGTLGRWADETLRDRAPCKHRGVYRLLFDSHLGGLHKLLIEWVWCAFVLAITPALLVVQSALYTTQLMSLAWVAEAWSRVMGLPLRGERESKRGAYARQFDIWAWNAARLAELVFEALPGFIVQAYAMSVDSRDSTPASGIAIVLFSLSTYMLVGHMYHYAMVYTYTGTAPWRVDPTIDYDELARATEEKRRASDPNGGAGTAPVWEEPDSVPVGENPMYKKQSREAHVESDPASQY